MPLPPSRIPVIIGIGEVKDRPADPTQGLEPLALMTVALRRAEADAGAALLQRLDSLDVVHEVSWPYPDLPALLCRRFGIAPRHSGYGPIGGETPLTFLHMAAERIARGEATIAAVCGGEAQYTVAQAQKAGITLPWTPRDPNAKPRTREYLAEPARRHGLDQPVKVYPLYENATQAAWGQAPEQGQAESARLWSLYSEVAARNPNSWLQRPMSAEEIATPGPGNRMIAWPYPKLMVANPMVNQGAAVLLASLEAARAAGIPEQRMVHLRGGAWANEPKHYMQRDQFTRSHAMDAVLEAALEMAEGDATRFAFREFYSCFPCVPKMARRRLGLPEDTVPTVAGGLTFHGAPLNAYMLHAACTMVRELREAPGALGLLYGQGGFVTNHRTLLLGAGGGTDRPLLSLDRQAEADRRRAPVPPLVEGRTGTATIETHTVVFRDDGTPDFGAVVLRLPDGARTMARVPREDEATLAALMSPRRSAIGLTGQLTPGREGLQEWRI